MDLSQLGKFFAPMWSADNRVPFGVQSMAELGERQPNGFEQAVDHSLSSLGTLPQRAFEASNHFRETGEYDPRPFLEAAMLTMGGTAFSAPKGALGAGPTRLKSDVMDLYRARLAGATDATTGGPGIDALIAERQAGVAAAAAKRQKLLDRDIAAGKIAPGSELTYAEQQMELRRAAQQKMEDARYAEGASDVSVPAPGQRLDSEVMRLFRSRGGGDQ